METKASSSVTPSVFFLFIIPLISCSPQLKDDQPLARVNNSIVRVHDYRIAIERLKFSDQSWSKRDYLAVKNSVIKSLIRRAVVLGEASRRGFSAAPAELEALVNEHRRQYEQGAFEQVLLDQKVSPEDWQEKLRDDLIIHKFMNSAVQNINKPSLKELLLYYEANPTKFRIPGTASVDQFISFDQKIVDEFVNRARNNPSKFQEIAQGLAATSGEENSAHTTVIKDSVPPELDQTIFSSQLNRIIGPLKTSYGYMAIRIISRSPSINRDFDTVKKEIELMLMEEQRAKLLQDLEDSLIRSATIDYNRKLIAAL